MGVSESVGFRLGTAGWPTLGESDLALTRIPVLASVGRRSPRRITASMFHPPVWSKSTREENRAEAAGTWPPMYRADVCD